ncbi:MAG: hypothetical protein LUD17_13660 [Bacteroidales bacterium]|nr:hypothetical protein [Bacteroidales bacterium]
MSIKEELIQKLKAENCFWSYQADSVKDVPDDILIEKTLIHLDMPEILQLFSIYPKKKIKQVWLHHLVPQGKYLWALNRLFARFLFDIKNPDSYLKAMETRYLNSL